VMAVSASSTATIPTRRRSTGSAVMGPEAVWVATMNLREMS
jgi:hypothetical protein